MLNRITASHTYVETRMQVKDCRRCLVQLVLVDLVFIICNFGGHAFSILRKYLIATNLTLRLSHNAGQIFDQFKLYSHGTTLKQMKNLDIYLAFQN